MWFQDFVTVSNQSYNCQTSHYLGRNRPPNARLSILLLDPCSTRYCHWLDPAISCTDYNHPNYDDKWNTLEYRNIYNQYICSALIHLIKPNWTHYLSKASQGRALFSNLFSSCESNFLTAIWAVQNIDYYIIVAVFPCRLRSHGLGCRKLSKLTGDKPIWLAWLE